MLYFAYGSNMLVKRIEKRIGSIRKLDGYFRLDKHKLCFHKISKKDGSAKADAFFSENDFVLGVVFEITEYQKPELDKAEGLKKGYDIKSVNVYNEREKMEAFTYYATKIDTREEILPFDWYIQLIISGGEQSGFPKPYLEVLKRVKCAEDKDIERKAAELQVLAVD